MGGFVSPSNARILSEAIAWVVTVGSLGGAAFAIWTIRDYSRNWGQLGIGPIWPTWLLLAAFVAAAILAIGRMAGQIW